MRWERLWADLAGQAEELDRGEREAEVVERLAIEQASVGLMDRVRGSAERVVRCEVRDGQRWVGVLVGHGLDWLALRRDDSAGADVVLVPADALCGVAGLSARVVGADALGPVGRRLSIGVALRRLRDGAHPVVVHRLGAAPLAGLVVAVGRDFVEIAADAVTWVVPTATLTGVVIR